MNLSSIEFSIYDFFIFTCTFIIFIIIFLLCFVVRGKLKIVAFSITFFVFISLPFINIFIMDKYINKAEFINKDSKKLVYINNYFISGIITNKSNKTINKCYFGVYINKIFPFQKPEFYFVLDDLNLAPNSNIDINQTIENFNFIDIKSIKFYCR